MKHIAIPLAAALMSGCLGPGPQTPVCWTIAPEVSVAKQERPAKWESVKVARVDVRQPFDGRDLAVLRLDGSVAFDRLNVFAAQPAALAKWAVCDILEGSGLAGRTVAPGSAAPAAYSLETEVSMLALDCRSGEPEAAVSVSLVLVSGREIVSKSKGAGRAKIVSGNLTGAFSSALKDAALKALEDL